MISRLRLVVFLVPMSILFAAVITSMIDLGGLLRVTTGMNNWILAHFSVAFSWGTFAFVLTCFWAFFSPLGAVKIGGADAVPILSKWNWFSITLCTTIAIGILFWATAEPIFHLNTPPAARGLEPGSPEAASFAMTSLFMHWSITPYAIYTVPGLTFALAYYNLGQGYSLSGPLSIILGKGVKGTGGDIIDAVALFSLIAGITATLGVGMMSISGGLEKVLGITNSSFLQVGVIGAIVGAFVVSSATGLQRGIRVLSDLNSKFFFLLCLFVFATGPSLYMVSAGWDGLVHYVVEFLPRSLNLGSDHDAEWSQAWTVFYWANWLAWAPITALFLGRIARGYTVRQFIAVNFFAPAAFAVVWMSVFGGAALYIDTAEGGGGMLKTALDTLGPESIAYEVLARYPLSGLLMIAFVFLSFISYVTAADSNTEAIAAVCQKQPKNHDPEAVDRDKFSLWLKVVLAVFIGAAAWSMTAFSGIDGVRMLSNLGGLPALFIVLLLNVTLLVLGTKYLKRLQQV